MVAQTVGLQLLSRLLSSSKRKHAPVSAKTADLGRDTGDRGKTRKTQHEANDIPTNQTSIHDLLLMQPITSVSGFVNCSMLLVLPVLPARDWPMLSTWRCCRCRHEKNDEDKTSKQGGGVPVRPANPLSSPHTGSLTRAPVRSRAGALPAKSQSGWRGARHCHEWGHRASPCRWTSQGKLNHTQWPTTPTAITLPKRGCHPYCSSPLFVSRRQQLPCQDDSLGQSRAGTSQTTNSGMRCTDLEALMIGCIDHRS